MALAPGTRLGVYEITAQIGVGGMGEVYRATDSNLKRPVAIKVLPASVAGDADRLARFQREAEVLAALNHPNIAASSGVVVVDRPPPKVSQLVWVDRTGREVATVGPRASINSFALAPDERRVVAEITLPEATGRALWLFDGVREEGNRLTYEGSPGRPLWARDGRHIYFRGSGTLSTLAIGATAATAFENPGPFGHFEDVTRDGRFLVCKSQKVPPEVWIQRVGSAERRALVQGPFAAMWPRVSPDNRWLAYALGLPAVLEVFAQPFDRPASGSRCRRRAASVPSGATTAGSCTTKGRRD